MRMMGYPDGQILFSEGPIEPIEVSLSVYIVHILLRRVVEDLRDGGIAVLLWI